MNHALALLAFWTYLLYLAWQTLRDTGAMQIDAGAERRRVPAWRPVPHERPPQALQLPADRVTPRACHVLRARPR